MSATETKESRYKDTIVLPKTDFPMKGNLPQTEPITIERWRSQNIYQKMVDQNVDGKSFVMPDGPPYANGNIHIGHVLNKVLKDIVIKYQSMQGKKSEFISGWDCHGLPIELKVTAALGDKKNQLSKKEIRQLCREEANKWVGLQRTQFQSLGVLAEWDKPYLTMDPSYEANEIRVLAKIHKNGALYRGNKPVYWCPALQTALAAAEVEYHDHKSPSIYVKFNIEDATRWPAFSSLDRNKKISFVIWTTTPWTLPANLAISLNASFEYGAYNYEDELLIIASKLKESVEKDTGISLGSPVKTWAGAELEKIPARHPFMNRDSIIILGDHVSLDAGTGCVHTAPGHGLDDYQVGLKYGLPILSPVDPAGLYTAEVPQYKGQHIWKANKFIPEDLRKSGHLLSLKDFVHSYPHNPRSKTPLIFRATPQWFIRMDGDFALRKKCLKAAEKDIQFFPDWGRPRLVAMITNTPDWCLSRQRTWGVPIPVFYCQKCDEPLADADIMNRIADAMEKSGQGLEAYFSEPVEKFVGSAKCSQCGHKEFKRGDDILDVWFDSGVCHTSVQRARLNNEIADIYLEGSDQHRGWFQTSLVSSMAAYEKPPFKALITHGFVNDASGHKMSKSKGNVIDPSAITQKFGAEILRLWAAHEDYGDDVTVSDEMFLRVSETYRRFRNTIRFLLGNLGDFKPQTDAVSIEKMSPIDRWALARLNEVIEKVTSAYENYDFYKVYHLLNQFFTTDLSATYLDALKDRLYTSKASGIRRRGSQTVLYELLKALVGMMAPILSFLSEETYKHFPGDNKSESVFLTRFPKPVKEWANTDLIHDFAFLNMVREDLAKHLEDLRRQKIIGSSLDATAVIYASGPSLLKLKAMSDELREFFIVSDVTVMDLKDAPKDSPTLPAGKLYLVVAQKAEGSKCERCWHYSPKTGADAQFPNVCPKCVTALG